MNAIAYVHEQLTSKKEFPAFKPGDNITVNYKIVEGNKERIQVKMGDIGLYFRHGSSKVLKKKDREQGKPGVIEQFLKSMRLRTSSNGLRDFLLYLNHATGMA